MTRELHPGPQPRTGRARLSTASGSPDCLDCETASALGGMSRQFLCVGNAAVMLRQFWQSSLDRFHIHREPSRLTNPSTIQNDKSCRPSPCGWLSQPRTTTAAPPLVCLIGENLGQHCWPGCVITLLKRASLVTLLILKHPRLGFDVCTPNSGPLLFRNITR